MQMRNRLLAGLLAACFAVAGVACETDDLDGGEPLEDDAPAENGSGGGY